MKLIELIIKHVPREKIHPYAKFFAQDDWLGDIQLSQFKERPVADYNGKTGYWYDRSYIMYSQSALPELAEDARDTVVTRDQLEYLWSLQDQGYTLVFGANPFTSPTGALVDIIPFNFGPSQTLRTLNVVWKNVIAYRPAHRLPIKNESRSRVEYHELDHADTIVAAAIEERLSLDGDTKWPVDSDKICVNLKTGYLSANGDDLVIITRKMWDEYVSRKIRVGDKVKTQSGAVVTVLHIGEKSAFVRYGTGDELAVSLNRITRVSE